MPQLAATAMPATPERRRALPWRAWARRGLALLLALFVPEGCASAECYPRWRI